MVAKVPKDRTNLWTWMAVAGGCVVATGVAFVLFVEAPPPTRIVIATGSTEGAYYRFATRYAELLAHDGISLEVRPTKGSVENVKLLMDEDGDVDVAFVQGGIADSDHAESLQSLCSLYREPLWIFYRGADPVS